jgi:hypothetical protein
MAGLARCAEPVWNDFLRSGFRCGSVAWCCFCSVSIGRRFPATILLGAFGSGIVFCWTAFLGSVFLEVAFFGPFF